MSAINGSGPAVALELENSGVAMISEIDHLRLAENRWRLGTNGYVYRVGARVKGRPCLLHRIVLNAQSGQEVHHLNEKKTDCRRENLELTTPSEHQRRHCHLVIARNKASRRYPDTAVCPTCSKVYRPDPDHRGRQISCSRSCGTIAGLRRARENTHAES